MYILCARIIYTHISSIVYNFNIQYSLLFKSSISNCQLKIFFVCGILHVYMWLYVWHVKYVRICLMCIVYVLYSALMCTCVQCVSCVTQGLYQATFFDCVPSLCFRNKLSHWMNWKCIDSVRVDGQWTSRIWLCLCLPRCSSGVTDVHHHVFVCVCWVDQISLIMFSWQAICLTGIMLGI